jgi:hypothetical protein
MDTPKEVEKLRARLKAMPRPEFLELADRAGVARSTAEKFRNGHSGKKRGSFVPMLFANALGDSKKAKPRA